MAFITLLSNQGIRSRIGLKAVENWSEEGEKFDIFRKQNEATIVEEMLFGYGPMVLKPHNLGYRADTT